MSDDPVICPNCNGQLNINAAEYSGKKIRCPKCKEVFQVPARSAKKAVPPAQVKKRRPMQQEELDDDNDTDQPPKRKKIGSAKRKSAKEPSGMPVILIASIGGGVLLVVLITVLVIIFNSGGGGPKVAGGGNSPTTPGNPGANGKAPTQPGNPGNPAPVKPPKKDPALETKLAAAREKEIREYQTKEKELIAKFPGFVNDRHGPVLFTLDPNPGKISGSIYSLAFSPNGRHLFSASLVGDIVVWDFLERKKQQSLTGHTSGVYQVAVSPDGKSLASASDDRTVRIWDLESWMTTRTLKFDRDVYSVAFTSGGKNVVIGQATSPDKPIQEWEIGTGNMLRELGPINKSFPSLSLSPNGKILSAGFHSSQAIVFDLNSGQEIHFINGGTKGKTTVAMSPDGWTLAVVGTGKTGNFVKLVDIETGAERELKVKSNGSVNSVAFSPDAKYLAATFEWSSSLGELADFLFPLELWDLETSQGIPLVNNGKPGTKPRFAYGNSMIKFSPGGLLLAGAVDSEIYVWSVSGLQRKD